LTAVSRGGVASWYRDLAHAYVDVFKHISAEDMWASQARRLAAFGTEKHVQSDPREAALLREAGALGTGTDWLHPSLMYRLLNPVWSWNAPLALVQRYTRHARLPKAATTPPVLDRPYVAVKAYFSRCLPDTRDNRARLQHLVDELAEQDRVVLLHTGIAADDHSELRPSSNVIDASDFMSPGTNLGVQTELVRNADSLVSTYGGFSYLGPLVGTPTAAVYASPTFSRAHLEVAEQVVRQLGERYSLRLLPE
jgi:hypothetical protein